MSDTDYSGYFEVETELAEGFCDECGDEEYPSERARGDKSQIVYCGVCGKEWHPGDPDYPTVFYPLVPHVGTRVRLRRDVERYPHFIAPAGAEGVVAHADEETYAVRLDAPLAGAEAWDNEVCWYPRNGDRPAMDVEAIR